VQNETLFPVMNTDQIKDGGYALFDGAHAPAWEPVLWPLWRWVCPAGAGRAAFPRGSAGTINAELNV